MISVLWFLRAPAPVALFLAKFKNSGKRANWAVAWCVLALVLCGWSTFGYAQTAAHFGGVQTVVASKGLDQCYGVAVDGNGNVYIADTYNNRVLKETLSAGQYTESVVASGLNLPFGVAVDGNLNVYVADRFNKRVLKETPSSGGYTATVVASGLSTSVSSVAVDSNSNVYIPDTVNNQVLMETPSGSGNSYTSSVVANAKNGLEGPMGVAVDASGNVYISDCGNNRVVEETPSSGSYTQSVVASGLDSPQGVAVDGSGNVYIANTYSNQILMETPSAGSYTQSTVATGPLSFPYQIAVDGDGNVYIANSEAFNVLKESPSGGNFGPINVGSQSLPISLIFVFDAAGTAGVPGVVMQGAPNQDFVDAGTGSCTSNGTSYPYGTGDTCTVDVTFSPQFAGIRYGAAWLQDNSGNLLASSYVQGYGVGPQVNFPPGPIHVIGGRLNNPWGIAVDGGGNVYLADSANGGTATVYKETPSSSGYAQSALFSNIANPSAVAVDGSGNIYIGNASGPSVKETLLPSGSYSPSPIGSFFNPLGIAIDGSGNVYVADELGTVYKETLTPAGYVQSTIASGLSQPAGVAVDGSGNIFVSLFGSDSVVEESPSPSGYIQSTVAGGMNYVGSLSVDGYGNVFVADTGLSKIFKLAPSAGGYVKSVMVDTSAAPLYMAPTDVAVDKRGNVFFTGDANSGPAAFELDLADAPALSFASTVYGTTTDSAQTVTVENTGNAPLSFPVPATGNNPSIPTSFTLDNNAASACPLVSASSSSAGTLAVGASCTLTVGFTPATVGAISGALVLTDHNASVQPVEQQSIALSGTATQATPQITWRTPAAITYGTALSGTQLDASATANGNKVQGKFIYKPAAGTIPKAGKPTLGVSFAPADATDYTTATATVTLQVNQATPQITWRAPAAITYGTALSGTQLDATATANGSKVQGTFTYTPAPGTIPTAGKPKLSVSFAPADSIDYAGATDTAYLTVNKAAPQSVLKSSAATITSGSSVKLTATLSAVGKGVAPTGTVAFLNGTKTLGTAKLAQGEATLTVDTLPVGTDSIKASYEGDGNYDTATSKAVSITVKSK